MGKQINNILIPVDFSHSTELAISKALSFCHDSVTESTIHLYHVQRPLPNKVFYFLSRIKFLPSQRKISTSFEGSRIKLEELKLSIEKESRKINVCCWMSFAASVQNSIADKARQLCVDLIIIGKRSHHSTFPFLNSVIPSKLAICTGIPVLTAKPGSFNKEIKTIVIPVSKSFPAKKLEFLTAFGNKSRTHIRLVIFKNDNVDFAESRYFLLESFRILKSQLVNLVNYEVLDGSNKPKALLTYCDKVGADVLIVTPGTETLVGKWFNSHISDMVPSNSKTQILAVASG